MEDVVENTGELIGWWTGKHFDKTWDRIRSRSVSNRKKREDVYRPIPAVAREQERAKSVAAARSKQAPTSSSSSHRGGDIRRSDSKGRNSRVRSPDVYERGSTAQSRPPTYSKVVYEERRVRQPAPETQVAPPAPKTQVATLPASRRKQAGLLFPAHTDFFTEDHPDSKALIKRLNEDNDDVLRAYEAEKDDPARNPASVLPEKDHWTLQKYEELKQLEKYEHPREKSDQKSKKQPSNTGSRRDSAMASGYNDDYRGNTTYQGEPRARSAQPPPRSRYEDDDSDYDERSGRRYQGGGRGYSDRDRDDDRYTSYEEVERYRGPVGAGPLVPVARGGAERRESYRNDPYAGGVVARRSDPYLNDRSQVSRKSRRDDRDDYDYDSRSRSRTRSRSRDGRGLGAIPDKIQDQFNTSKKGAAVGIAGAVAGGLAARQFGGNKQHRQRDTIIGAVVGGLAANFIENKWEEHNSKKEREDDRYDDRSRSRGRQ